MSDGDSFLPRIQSVFYAVFDLKQGPKILYQVPEGLIAGPSNETAASIPPTPTSETPSTTPIITSPSYLNGLTSRNSSTSLASPTDFFRVGGRQLTSASDGQKRLVSAQRTLFNFNDISMYIIPPSALCGRLVTCTTRKHRIIGFPVELTGNYDRNYFRYNLCFVFNREADLSCYEPIVRKISRVLKSCEEESNFLSSIQTSPLVHAVLEQLYEDLNSYSETSIAIDQFNSIELKIFPFYPNPPAVKDWMVPLALINLTKRIEDNWDLTMRKVCKHINGVNHVSRIAHLADVDIALTRSAICHLLYYQVIMTIDIFQYSNMYTLRKSIQWLADESHVKTECGPYVTKPGRSIPDWPKLLHLYSRLKPGKTVYEWMKAYDVEAMGIDVRRFTSFGVIKGFLRRVHRYPIYTPPDSSNTISDQLQLQAQNPMDSAAAAAHAHVRARGASLSEIGPTDIIPIQLSARLNKQPSMIFQPAMLDTMQLKVPESPLPPALSNNSASQRARRASAAERVLEQLRSRDLQRSGSTTLSSPRNSWIRFQDTSQSSTGSTTTIGIYSPDAPISKTTHQSSLTKPVHSTRPEGRRHSLITPIVPPPSPVVPKANLTPSRAGRPSRSPSSAQLGHLYLSQTSQPTVPPELISLLDGDHHTDELGVKFEAAWPLLEQWLSMIGGGHGDGDYGRISIICR
ncbi:nitrogen permease regulator 2-domain-containing protein [Panaeolus papilionaceus]|nr:nitrogen permease regulator 2-domain-containing protein [Panaeolus papilionaceus]